MSEHSSLQTRLDRIYRALPQRQLQNQRLLDFIQRLNVAGIKLLFKTVCELRQSGQLEERRVSVEQLSFDTRNFWGLVEAIAEGKPLLLMQQNLLLYVVDIMGSAVSEYGVCTSQPTAE